MHYTLEIVMPQVEDAEEAVEQIMRPFSENIEPDDDEGSPKFWDFYSIGGRWAGRKMKAKLDQDKVKAFYEELKEKNITVSGLTCGKQEISPASQIPVVDEIWANYFPKYKSKACPIFKHSNNQYKNDCLYGDVMPFNDVPPELTASRLIIASYRYDDSKLEAIKMFSESIWNGVNSEKTGWDGTFKHGMEMFERDIASYKQEWIDKHTPKDDWLVVTVDYHS